MIANIYIKLDVQPKFISSMIKNIVCQKVYKIAENLVCRSLKVKVDIA